MSQLDIMNKHNLIKILFPKVLIDEFLQLLIFSLLLSVFELMGIYVVRKFGLHLPGYKGLYLMPFLIVVKTRWETKISATYIAIFSTIIILGIMPIIWIFGRINAPFFVTLIIPAIALDIMWPITERFYDNDIFLSIIISFISSLAYLCSIPFLTITWHLGFGEYLITHFTSETVIFMYLIFGTAGGIIGSFTNKQLREISK